MIIDVIYYFNPEDETYRSWNVDDLSPKYILDDKCLITAKLSKYKFRPR